jgi:hypothetical protein
MATQPQVTEAPKNNEPERGVDPKDGQEKFIFSYQPRDKEGQFIGKPYKYFYTDHADLSRQLAEGKENGDRFIYEVKTGKRKIEGEPAAAPVYQPAPESKEEAERKRREEFRKTAEQEFGAPVEIVRKDLEQSRKLKEGWEAYNWSLNKQAEGYYPCAENSKKITGWLKEKNYAFTPANYDLAFEELKDTLVQAPKEQPVAPADSTQQPPTRAEVKPQSTGIIPGQFAGTRQPNSTERQPLTRERFREINKMGRDAWKKFERTNPKEAEAYLKMKYAQPQQ